MFGSPRPPRCGFRQANASGAVFQPMGSAAHYQGHCAMAAEERSCLMDPNRPCNVYCMCSPMMTPPVRDSWRRASGRGRVSSWALGSWPCCCGSKEPRVWVLVSSRVRQWGPQGGTPNITMWERAWPGPHLGVLAAGDLPRAGDLDLGAGERPRLGVLGGILLGVAIFLSFEHKIRRFRSGRRKFTRGQISMTMGPPRGKKTV